MGAGSFPAGEGFAGFDPGYTPPAAPLALRTPVAIEYDPATRTYVVQASDGTLVEIHPIDQQVAILLTIEDGSVPSTTGTGARFRKLVARADPANIPGIALNEAKRVLADLITSGDIELVSVTTDTSVPGRVYIYVEYKNLRLASAPNRTVTVASHAA